MPAPFSSAPAAQSNLLARAVSSSERLRAVEQRDVWGRWARRRGDLQVLVPYSLIGALEP